MTVHCTGTSTFADKQKKKIKMILFLDNVNVLSSLPDNIAENAELTEAIDQLDGLARADHVVKGGGWLDHVHEDVGAPLLRVPEALQQGPDVLPVHVVAAPLALGLQHKSLWVFQGLGHSVRPCFVLSEMGNEYLTQK